MKTIYKFNYQGYRGGLNGVFVEDSDFVKKCLGLIVTEHDMIGKHSEDSFVISSLVLAEVSNDPKHVEMFEDLKIENGYNPFNSIRESIECEDIVLRQGIYMREL